jgi:tRNA (guanine26-N2/guanine27-N2)-dimethyltransferase
MRVSEGGVDLTVPVESTASEGVGDEVFFNPDQELNRDLTVAVLRVLAEDGAESYLDATAATGVRGVRAATAGYDVTLCDRDPDAVECCERNLSSNGLDGNVVCRDVNAFMHDHHHGFDIVDLDPFGTPIPFADAGVRAARDVLCVTATDTAPLCGAHFDSGVRTYSAVPRNTEYHPEMGLRILVSALVRTAARYDVAARPVLSHATRHYVRTYLALDRGAGAADAAVSDLGYVHHCPECLYRDHAAGLVADPPEVCPHCDGDQTLTAGPIYLTRLHDPEFVGRVHEAVAGDAGLRTADELIDLLSTLEAELDTPTHYDQHRLCKRWGRPATAMDDFLDALGAAGHDASRTHHGGTTFKTDADVGEIRAATATGE